MSDAQVTETRTKSLATIGLLFSFFLGPVGLVICVIALFRSRRRGGSEPAAIAGVIVGALSSMVFIAAMWFIASFFSGQIGPCAELGPGTHEVGLVTYECGEP